MVCCWLVSIHREGRFGANPRIYGEDRVEGTAGKVVYRVRRVCDDERGAGGERRTKGLRERDRARGGGRLFVEEKGVIVEVPSRGDERKRRGRKG